MRRMIQWVGAVDDKTTAERLSKLSDLHSKNKKEEIHLLVCSYGGETSAAFAFYDFVRINKMKLVTTGLGMIGSAGVIIWLAGTRRQVSKHSLLFLHNLKHNVGKETSLEPDELGTVSNRGKKFKQMYAEIVAENSKHKLTSSKVRKMMEETCVLTPQEMLELGLAHEILH